MKYEKIIKWLLLALFIVGAVFSFYGFAVGFDSNADAPVDNMLYCAYIYAGIAILAVLIGVVVIGGINNPKTLVKLLAGIVVIAAIIAVAYVLAPGTPAVGYLGEPVSDMTLKLTDTMLNLTYLLCGGAILSLIVGAIVSATRK
jgi:glucan phosphoethanolaminetransferase (alkaline phosphatase superfamily)